MTDVDEDGEITFSSVQPQARTGLVATLVDEDVVQSIQSWQWEISGSNNQWTTITGATTGTYTPLDDHVGKYLRVTATYTDGHGSGKTATATTANSVETAPTSNVAPAFSTDTTQRSIAENTPAGRNIGEPVTATDNDNDTLTYSLGGTDAASFDIVQGTGQLQTEAALDFETKSTYTVTVTARDPSNETDTITVTINVTDVNESPEFDDGDTAGRSIAENTAANTNIGSPLKATDPERDTLTYSLDRASASLFSIGRSTGQLKTKAALDKETTPSYTVTVSVRDSRDASGTADTATDDTITVTITVTGVNDPPDIPGGSTDALNYAENGTGPVRTYTATDPENNSISWALSGADRADFSITGGALTFRQSPDYEAPADANGDNVYLVTVNANDGHGGTDAITVTITVTNVEESGTVTLSHSQPSVDTEVTATLADPDGGVTSKSWQWKRSDNQNSGYTNISGASSSLLYPGRRGRGQIPAGHRDLYRRAWTR